MDDSEVEVRNMIQRAVTDVGPRPEGSMSPGVANLFTVLKALGTPETHDRLTGDYKAGTLRYVELKGTVADAVWATAAQIQSRKAAYPLERVQQILRAGR